MIVPPIPVLTPVRTVYVGDTIISGQSSQKLGVTYSGSFPYVQYLYTTADADRVWIYSGGQFYKMHDFNALPGDSWMYKGPLPTGYICAAPIQVTVDSVGQRLVGGQIRRWFTIHYQLGTDTYRSGRMYEGLGSLQGYFTPIGNACVPADGARTLLAQCYGTAAQPGLIVMGTLINCRTGVTAAHSAAAADFAVYPTAGAGELTVKLPAAYARATVHVFSAAGQLVRQLPLAQPESTLHLQKLPRGLYMLSVQQPGQPVLRQRIVLQ